VLHLFPSSALDNSVLQETLGWNLSGLIVPGYLASIFVIQPTTAMVVVVEGLLTWLAAALLSDLVPRWWPWSPLFGRDRFFMLLLLSVAVRLVLESAGLSQLAADLGVPYDTDLHSIGLVLVPLVANALRRSGPVNAIPWLLAPLAVTWVTVKYLLIPYGGLSLASFALSNDNPARDFNSSPQAYVLLLCGAGAGSFVNRRWGWDFGGIIISALLAICWANPLQIVTTLGEAMVVAALLAAALRTPLLRTANLTGGRPMVLAFTLAYAVRYVLGWWLGDGAAGIAVRDLFGFGYLLSSILALRILKHGEIFRSVVPLVVTSFVGFFGGSVVGYALAIVMPPAPPAPLPPGTASPATIAQRVLESAWRDSGPVPAGIGQSVARQSETLVSGGEGFGGLWIRSSGENLAVVGSVGPYGLGPATLAVADALQARVVLVCAVPASRACEAAADEIALWLPVLHVSGGDATSLRSTPDVLRLIDFARLSETLGASPAAPESGPPVLTLAPDARAHAALAEEEREPLENIAAVAPSTAVDVASLRRFRDDVAMPWLDWSVRGGPWMRSLSIATSRRLGLTSAEAGDSVTFTGGGWWARLGRTPTHTVVAVHNTGASPATESFAEAVAASLDASLLVVVTDTREHAADAPPDGDHAQTLLLAAIAAYGEDVQVVSISSINPAFDPGADVVIGSGQRTVSRQTGSPLALRLAGLFNGAGLGVAYADGSAQRAGTGADDGDLAAALRAAGAKNGLVSVDVSATGLQRFAPGVGATSDGAGSGVGSLPGRRTVELATLNTWTFSPAGPESEARRRAIEAAIPSLQRGDSTDILRVEPSLQVLCVAKLGCRWISVDRCDERACTGFVMPLYRLPPGTPPAAGGPEAGALSPIASMALGSGDLTYTRPLPGNDP
jgi:hypothetical protein